MNPTQQLLERVRSRLPNKTDYAVAKALHISTQRMSAYVNGINELCDDDVICRAAEIVGDDPAIALATFNRLAAKSDCARAAWTRLEKLAKKANRHSETASLQAA